MQIKELVTGTREEAEDVIDGLKALINHYEVATLADMYTLAGLTSEFTDDKWGWTDLRSATIRSVQDGYLIVVPPPLSLSQE